MWQKLRMGGFKWVENTSQFSEDLHCLKHYNKDSDKR